MARQSRRLVAAALFGYLFAVVGMPLPETRSSSSATRYPCENRRCGCVSAEHCWRGDCCCFTLEEKLAWAEANGVEPPPHVRPMVASRAQSSPAATKKSCCCCENKPAIETVAENCCDAQSTNCNEAVVTFVIGILAQKCRGLGLAGQVQLDPVTPPNLKPVAVDRPGPGDSIAVCSEHVTSLSQSPPTPPPRST